jgi:mRNA interferase RelE/StbE
MPRVETSRATQKFLEKTAKPLRERIEERLKRLAHDPVPSDAKYLGRDEDGDKCFRLRIGDYRAIYTLMDGDRLVLITKIEKREHAYQ